MNETLFQIFCSSMSVIVLIGLYLILKPIFKGEAHDE